MYVISNRFCTYYIQNHWNEIPFQMPKSLDFQNWRCSMAVYLFFYCELDETRQGQGNFKQKRMLWLHFSYKGLGELSETPLWKKTHKQKNQDAFFCFEGRNTWSNQTCSAVNKNSSLLFVSLVNISVLLCLTLLIDRGSIYCVQGSYIPVLCVGIHACGTIFKLSYCSYYTLRWKDQSAAVFS